jgi:O-antigen/teichoic acid export membrane protein
MSPLAVLTGIILGSAVTIVIGLGMVLVVFLIMGGEQPTLAREYFPLLKSFFLFLGLAFVSGYAFIGTLRQKRWLWLAQGGTWLVIAVLAAYYWPK